MTLESSRSAFLAAVVGILLAHTGGLLQRFPSAQAAWGWSPSPAPMPMPMPSPSPPPSPPPVVCGTWGAWGGCSVTCGAGTRERTRSGSCSPFRETENCNDGACPQPCGEWAQWAACPVTCGGGTRSRSRSGGCSSFTESEACNSAACPVPCGAWGQWSTCSTSCGDGTRSRSRTGECNGNTESGSCNLGACPAPVSDAPPSPPSPPPTPPTTASCGVWQQWSACTPTCGMPATRMRSRGGECQPFFESEACSQDACPAPSPPPSTPSTPSNPPSPPPTTTMAPTTATTAATTVATTARPTSSSSVVEVRMRIASDFNEAARDIDNFRESFREGMAAAGGISKDRILVRAITKGSIIVDFVVTGAEQMGDVSAAVAVQDVEMRLADQTYSWPTALRTMMASGASVQSKSTRSMSQAELDAMAITSGSATVFLTPEAGYAAPTGCSCVAGPGIAQGCAKHKDINPPWCLVAAGCRESSEGVLGAWTFCVQSTGSSPEDRNKMIIASGDASAARITWLLLTVFLQGLLTSSVP